MGTPHEKKCEARGSLMSPLNLNPLPPFAPHLVHYGTGGELPLLNRQSALANRGLPSIGSQSRDHKNPRHVFFSSDPNEPP